MAWEISHSFEAWGAFYKGLCDQPIDWLREADATCQADRQEQLDKLFWDACWTLDIDDDTIDAIPDWQSNYKKALDQQILRGDDKQSLIDRCYAWTERNRTCSNGGFEFYVDEGGYYSICLDDYEADY